MKTAEFVRYLGEVRASAILRTSIAEAAPLAMNAAVEAGFRVVEFTLTTPGAYDLIGEFSKREGVVVGAGTSSGNFGDVFIGTATWQYNVNFLYQLPKNFSISANINGREGYTLPLYFRVDNENSDGILERTNLQIANVDTYRLDDIHLIDLGVSYLVQLAGDTTVDLGLEIFNVTNDDTLLQMERRIGSTTAGRIDEVLSPRVYRLSAKVVF